MRDQVSREPDGWFSLLALVYLYVNENQSNATKCSSLVI